MTRVAIVGGGPGGLAAAAFLHQAGVAAVVYEQARELREVGAGIMVPPNAARMLRRLGVLGPLSERAVQLDIGWEFRRWQDGTVLSAQDLAAKSGRLYGEHTYTVHRADLLDAVKHAVPADAVKLGRRLDGFTPAAAGVSLSFADGERAEADVLIGADGIHSVIRAALTAPVPPAHSGMCAFRALVPAGPGAAPLRVRAHRPREQGSAGQLRPRGLQPPARRPGTARRDEALQAADPLAANAWIYAHDPLRPH